MKKKISIEHLLILAMLGALYVRALVTINDTQHLEEQHHAIAVALQHKNMHEKPCACCRADLGWCGL